MQMKIIDRIGGDLERQISRFNLNPESKTTLQIKNTKTQRNFVKARYIKSIFLILLSSTILSILLGLILTYFTLDFVKSIKVYTIVLSVFCVILLLTSVIWSFLHGKYSPIWKWKMIGLIENATERLDLLQNHTNTIKQTKTVEWIFFKKDEKMTIFLNPSGTISSPEQVKDITRRLTEFLIQQTHDEWNLISSKLEHSVIKIEYGELPRRLKVRDLFEITTDDVFINYTPIQLYGEVEYNFTSEASHQLIISPSGSGKTLLLAFEIGMLIKQGHMISVVDAKNSSFGTTLKNLGINVAVTPDEIIQLLNELVEKMRQRYETFFSMDSVSFTTNYKNFGLSAHFLVFDEVLSALESGTSTQKSEMTRLLKILALQSRMSGVGLLILTSQKLLASDLPRSITEQCQTKIVVGSDSSITNETFYSVTGVDKKDIMTEYRGAVGKGYAVTPKTGLEYIELPWYDLDSKEYKTAIREFQQIIRHKMEYER